MQADGWPPFRTVQATGRGTQNVLMIHCHRYLHVYKVRHLYHVIHNTIGGLAHSENSLLFSSACTLADQIC